MIYFILVSSSCSLWVGPHWNNTEVIACSNSTTTVDKQSSFRKLQHSTEMYLLSKNHSNDNITDYKSCVDYTVITKSHKLS